MLWGPTRVQDSSGHIPTLFVNLRYPSSAAFGKSLSLTKCQNTHTLGFRFPLWILLKCWFNLLLDQVFLELMENEDVFSECRGSVEQFQVQTRPMSVMPEDLKWSSSTPQPQGPRNCIWTCVIKVSALPLLNAQLVSSWFLNQSFYFCDQTNINTLCGLLKENEPKEIFPRPQEHKHS